LTIAMPPPSALAQLWPWWKAEWIWYQDDDLVVIDKPAGIASQPTEPDRRDDAHSRLAAWLAEQTPTAEAPLSSVQRLDRLASGLVVYGRSRRANRALARDLARGLPRRYLVGLEDLGRLGQQGPDRELRHRIVERQGRRLLVEIETSDRRHGIRAELAELGAPIAGDGAHGGPPAPRLMLHLGELALNHPATGEPMPLRCTPPPVFARWLHAAHARQDQLDDVDALEQTLRSSAELRFALATEPHTTAFRLCNGEGDGVAGVTVDRYGDFLVASLVGPAAAARDRVLDALARLGPRGIYLKLPPRTARCLTEAGRDDVAPPLPVRGEAAPDALEVREHGLGFEVRLGDGLSTGLFLDQRANRERVRATASGRRVLNLFAYTGSFSVAAVAGGAAATTTVDVSRKALDWAARNLALLGRPSEGHRLVRADARDWLTRCARRGERFDLVVLDPPSFATTKRSRFAAAEDYAELAGACLRCLEPAGRLLACTNHRGMARARLARELRQVATSLGCRLRRLEHLPPPTDFPPPPGEECHLKAILIELEGR
jgi:23S rRNA (cytosine1962-C5)-methyltransferase